MFALKELYTFAVKVHTSGTIKRALNKRLPRDDLEKCCFLSFGHH